jgi:DNA polymerase elongation subunit (family B)
LHTSLYISYISSCLFIRSILSDCKYTEDAINRGYENALLLVTKAIDKIMIGGDGITQDDLVISKLLGQYIEKYRSLFPHVSAAIQLSNGEDKHPSKDDTVKYIYINSNHKNPLCRVTPIDSTDGHRSENWIMIRKNIEK